MSPISRCLRALTCLVALGALTAWLEGCGPSAAGCPKFQSLMQEAACSDGQPVEMAPHYSAVLRGRILSGGVPVEDATVVAEVFDWRVHQTAVSDHQGVFQFEDLRPETYRIVICRKGFRPLVGFAFVSNDYLERPLMAELQPAVR